MRIDQHPVLKFEKGKEIKIYYGDKEMTAYEGETIAAALHANGILELSHSSERDRPRGFYCAIGNCSSCLMEVNGVPNVKVCIELVEADMRVRVQNKKGDIV